MRRIGGLYLLFVWVLTQSVFLVAATAESNYVSATVNPSGQMSRGEFRRLRTFELKGPVDSNALEQTRQNIMKTGRFLDVSIRTVDRSNGTGLVFDVIPRPYATRIRLIGNSQVSDRILRKAMDLSTYMAADDEQISVAASRLADHYELLGFPVPAVRARLEGEDGAPHVTVRFDIDETPLATIHNFELNLDGKPGFWTRTRLKFAWLFFRFRLNHIGFNTVAIDARMRTFTKQLHEMGYLDSNWRFNPELEVASPDTPRGVVLNVGQPSVIKAKNLGFFASRRIADAWRRRNHSLGDRELSRLSRSAVNELKQKGYLEATASVHVDQWHDKTLIALTAEPGTRYYAAQFDFEGNRAISNDRLRKALPLHAPTWYGLKSWIRQESAKDAANALAGFYRSIGYPDVTVEGTLVDDTDEARHFRFKIVEGEHRVIDTLVFSGSTAVSQKTLRKTFSVRAGDPLDWSRLRTASNDLQRLFKSRGYMDVSIDIQAGEAEGERIPVTILITENTRHDLDALLVRGNFKTASSVVFDAAHLDRGDPFDLEPLSELQQRLYELDLFDSVVIRPEAQASKDGIGETVVVDVRERPTGYFEGGVDINTERGIELTGKIGDRNVFGKAISVSISALAGSQQSSTALSISQPNFLGSRLNPFANASYTDDRTQSGFSEAVTTIGAGASRRFTKAFRASLEYSYERRTAFDVARDVSDELDYEEGRIASIIPGISYDSRDDMFFPRRGSLIFARLKSSLDFLGGTMNFQRLECGIRHYQPLGTYTSLALALRGGRTWIGGGDIPLGERFFLGGASSHRGFREKDLGPHGSADNPLGGLSYWLGNAELRFPLYQKLSAGIFVDLGNTFLTEPAPPYIRPAAGFGLRLDTPVGPIRADLGFNLDQRDNESLTAFHLAIGHAF